MKVIPILLAQHQQQAATSMALLWKVTRRDGQIFGFTSHDQDIPYDGLVYQSRAGFDASQISTSAGLAVDNMNVSGPQTPGVVTEADLMNRAWDYAEVRLARCNWKRPADGIEKMRLGWLGELSTRKFSFTSELLGLAQKLQQPVGRVYTAACDANLGDARCGVNLAPFTVTGTVASSASAGAFADTSRTEADTWFQGGLLTWVTGANAGVKIEVKAYAQAGGAFELHEQMRSLISAGDTYSVHAGCSKSRDGDCKVRFNNVLNHRGFPVKPTQDQLMSGT